MTDALFDTETTAPAGQPPVPAGAVHTVIGIDVSLTGTGIACRHRAAVITGSGRKDATLSQRQQRLRHLRTKVIAQIVGCPECASEPDLILIEGPSYASTGSGTHDRSGLWWLLIDVFSIRGWRVEEISPNSRAKYATGKGNASKDQVLSAAVRRLPQDVDDNNAADAAWLCALGYDLLGAPLVDLPQDHRAALVTVRARIDAGGQS